MTNTTKIFLNTWGAYNNGCIGFGWFTPDEAREFIEENPERAGGEWFIADIDNYLGIEFDSLEYANVYDVCETIETLENMDDYEKDEIIALMEVYGYDLDEAIVKLDYHTFYENVESYFECMDELVEMEAGNASDFLFRYFDFEAYHRDLMFDATEVSNGVVIVG